MSPSLIISKSSIHQEWREKNIFAGSPSLNKKQSLNHLKLLKYEDSETFPFCQFTKNKSLPKIAKEYSKPSENSPAVMSFPQTIWVNNKTNILAARSPPPPHLAVEQKSMSFRLRLQQNQVCFLGVFFVCVCAWKTSCC